MKIQNVIFYSTLLVLTTMHTVGLIGITGENSGYYVDLTAVNLCITTCCMLLNSTKNNLAHTLMAFIGVSLFGFLVEVIGVKTQVIFGNYWYGTNMGPKIAEVPLVIGLNWGVLIFSCAAIVHHAYKSIWLKAFVGACLMVIMDLVLEPIALKLQYWNWLNNEIPVQNYFAWWVLSFVLLYALFSLLKDPKNVLGKWVYMVQITFFCALHLLL